MRETLGWINNCDSIISFNSPGFLKIFCVKIFVPVNIWDSLASGGG